MGEMAMNDSSDTKTDICNDQDTVQRADSSPRGQPPKTDVAFVMMASDLPHVTEIQQMPCCSTDTEHEHKTPIYLNVYDVSPTLLGVPLGLAFHTGVEVANHEFYFG